MRCSEVWGCRGYVRWRAVALASDDADNLSLGCLFLEEKAPALRDWVRYGVYTPCLSLLPGEFILRPPRVHGGYPQQLHDFKHGVKLEAPKYLFARS